MKREFLLITLFLTILLLSGCDQIYTVNEKIDLAKKSDAPTFPVDIQLSLN